MSVTMNFPTRKNSWRRYSKSDCDLIKMWAACLLFSNISCTVQPSSTPPTTTTELDVGKPMDIEGHPYYVSIEGGVSHSCGGAILSAHWVVTSVDCSKIPNAIIRAGTNNWRQNGTEHHIRRTILHDKYNNTRHRIPSNDIALIEVVEHFPFDRFHQPIIPSNKESLTRPGTRALVSGIGQLADSDTTLVQLKMSIIELDECNKAYKTGIKHFKGLSKGKFCTKYYKEANLGPCHADNGNPLVVGDQLIGILTWHDKDCENTMRPAVFTRIADHSEWISVHVNFSDWRTYL